MEIIPKYKIGDNVKIVNYGHLFAYNKISYPEWNLMYRLMQQSDDADFGVLAWGGKREDFIKEELIIDLEAKPENIIAEDELFYWVDINPSKIGTKDIVKDVKINQGLISYSLVHSAWYDEKQLELVD